jgi:vacuolar-type H+-ATPase subunit H
MSGSHARAVPVHPGPSRPQGAAAADVQQDLDELRHLIEQARAMPMSSSCVINRAEVLELIDQMDEHLGQALQQATQVDAERSEIVRRAHDEAELIVSDARSRRDDLVSDSEVFRLASTRAEQLVSEATEESQMLRRDADGYVEGRLAALETSLQATLEAVTRGRSRLQGRNPLEELGRDSHDPFPGRDD